MSARIRHITFDCRDPHALARFWGGALGFVDDPANPNHPDDPEALIVDPTGHHPGLLFIPVPEPKVAKNRLHLDLQPADGRDLAVDRLRALGATVLDDRRRPDGTGWVVVADPEGNELCVERSATERDGTERDGTSAPTGTGMGPPAVIRDADERTMLTGMLDWYRAGVLRKVDGVSPHHAAAQPFRSPSSIAGLLKHLALVEDAWFGIAFAGRPPMAPFAGIDWDADPDWEFHTALDEPLDDLVGLYRTACERSRAVVAEHDLDDVGVDPSRPRFTLRYVLLHLVEETARHLGHLDVLREHLDGTTGD